MDSAELVFDDIRMMLNTSISWFVHLRKRTLDWNGFFAWLWSVKFSFWLMITDHLTLTLLLDGTHQIAHSRPLLFRNFPFLLFHRFLLTWSAVHPFLPLCLILRFYFKTQARCPGGPLVSIFTVFRFRRPSFPRFRVFWITGLIVCFTLGQWYCYRKLDVIMTLKNELWGFALHWVAVRRKAECPTTLLIPSQGYVPELWCMWRWSCLSFSLFAKWWY